MNEKQKLNLTNSFEKKYKGRKNFKTLFRRMQRALYKDDILQPQHRRYRDVWHKQHLIADATEREAEYTEKKKTKELDEAYRANGSKRVLTIEQKILKDLQKENPNMVSEEDIIKWPTMKR